MDNQISSELREPAHAAYDAPRAQRLSDAVPAKGTTCGSGNNPEAECQTNGSAAIQACVTGTSATACRDNGNSARQGCYYAGNTAFECGSGSSPR